MKLNFAYFQFQFCLYYSRITDWNVFLRNAILHQHIGSRIWINGCRRIVVTCIIQIGACIDLWILWAPIQIQISENPIDSHICNSNHALRINCGLCPYDCVKFSDKYFVVFVYSSAGTLCYHLHDFGRHQGYCLDGRISNFHHVWWNHCNYCSRLQRNWRFWNCLVWMTSKIILYFANCIWQLLTWVYLGAKFRNLICKIRNST